MFQMLHTGILIACCNLILKTGEGLNCSGSLWLRLDTNTPFFLILYSNYCIMYDKIGFKGYLINIIVCTVLWIQIQSRKNDMF